MPAGGQGSAAVLDGLAAPARTRSSARSSNMHVLRSPSNWWLCAARAVGPPALPAAQRKPQADWQVTHAARRDHPLTKCVPGGHCRSAADEARASSGCLQVRCRCAELGCHCGEHRLRPLWLSQWRLITYREPDPCWRRQEMLDVLCPAQQRSSHGALSLHVGLSHAPRHCPRSNATCDHAAMSTFCLLPSSRLAPLQRHAAARACPTNAASCSRRLCRRSTVQVRVGARPTGVSVGESQGSAVIPPSRTFQ